MALVFDQRPDDARQLASEGTDGLVVGFALSALLCRGNLALLYWLGAACKEADCALARLRPDDPSRACVANDEKGRVAGRAWIMSNIDRGPFSRAGDRGGARADKPG